MSDLDLSHPKFSEFCKLFGIKPSSTKHELHEAYKEMKSVYSSDNKALYSLGANQSNEFLDSIELKNQQLDLAYKSLLGEEYIKMPLNKPKCARVQEDLLNDEQIQSRLKDILKSSLMGQGELLKTVRELGGISLETVHEQTRISQKILCAFESEDREALPNPYYAKGLLKTYCEYLTIPLDVFVDKYFEV